MAYYNDASTRSDLTERLLGGIADLFEAARIRHARRRVYRNTFAELAGLSDRDLTDLGLHRSTIRRLAWDTALEQFPR